ncbi:hypothetical protein EVAR_22349_1 [Eumeta japonica]|uniref:Endonuclease/exonuclease/phosphatase domain-containing protein n=1 Tax=Eumeta variegata TaxID=151549 RepID=A0A4C1VJE2_EUMVA|nr:hypothetical protein EVAR_22349_1 [Eumeta japonica]
MTGYGVLVLVSVYLPPKKKLLQSDLEAPLPSGDAVILFGDLNSKPKLLKWKLFKMFDESITFDDREKAECLADSIDQQDSDNPSYDFDVHSVEEECSRRKRSSALRRTDRVNILF